MKFYDDWDWYNWRFLGWRQRNVYMSFIVCWGSITGCQDHLTLYHKIHCIRYPRCKGIANEGEVKRSQTSIGIKTSILFIRGVHEINRQSESKASNRQTCRSAKSQKD